MTKIRLKDQLKDFDEMGLSPKVILDKEDGRRDNSQVGHNEVWYFDGIFDDGSKIVLGMRPGDPYNMTTGIDRLNFNLLLTKPDGETLQDFIYTDNDKNSISKDHLDVEFGNNYAKGTWKDFDINAKSEKGFACSLHYHALVEPFRQGTGVIALGDNEENYYTDLSVPNCIITGTLFYDGENHEVTGRGYHDHQWMNISPYIAWHHWLWGHMYTKDYTVYIYDFVSSEKYGFTRIPMFGVQDNHTGKTIFKTNGNMTLTTELEPQKDSGRPFPKTSHYCFDNGDMKVNFDLIWKDEIEVRDTYQQNSPAGQKQLDLMGIHPLYVRYFAQGKVKIEQNGKVIEQAGDLIYEYNYMGIPDKRAHV